MIMLHTWITILDTGINVDAKQFKDKVIMLLHFSIKYKSMFDISENPLIELLEQILLTTANPTIINIQFSL